MNWSGASGAATALPFSGLTPSLNPPTVRGSVQVTGSSSSSLTYAYPAGTRTGDVIIGIQNGTAFTPLSCTPAPWWQLDTKTQPASNSDFLVGHVVHDEGALGVPSAVLVGATIFVGTLVVLTNSPAGLIILDQEAGANAVDAASIASPTITTTQPNEICLVLAEHASSAGTLSLSGPAGITLIKQGNSQVIGSFPKAAAGTTTAVTITDSGGTSGHGWVVFVCSFMPCGN